MHICENKSTDSSDCQINHHHNTFPVNSIKKTFRDARYAMNQLEKDQQPGSQRRNELKKIII